MAQTCVEVISQETIKPSSPTPQHLRKLKLSYLDQILDHAYISLIFIYQADGEAINKGSHVQKSQRLKNSLSLTLTSFYPLAGRIQDNFTIDCNDAGVEFIDARAVDSTRLMDAIQEQPNNINEDHLKQYLPMDPTTTSKPLFLVQVTYFDCGGIVVGVLFSHRIADCASIMDFINAWAHANETDGLPTTARLINFDLANYFPGIDFPRFGFAKTHDEKFRTKRFVFDKVKLESLRELADSNVKKPTRVELISAFIWDFFMQFSSSAHIDGNNDKIFCAGHAVNLRGRKKSLENVFGNCVMVAIASEESSSLGGGEFHEVVSKLRSAIQRVDGEYITNSMQQSGDGGFLKDLIEFGCMFKKGLVELLMFTSWCRFPVYEADFGWGKPILFCPAEMLNNSAILVESRCGERIEVWVRMNQDAFSILEAKFKLI